MPINIFNIRNVNYVNSEASDSGKVKKLFKNQRVSQVGPDEEMGLKEEHTNEEYREHRHASSKSRQRVLGRQADSDSRVRHSSLITKVDEHQRTHSGSTKEGRKKSRDRTPEDTHYHQRQRSVDSKSLVAMMSHLNELKKTEEGKRTLFQKLNRHKPLEDRQATHFFKVVEDLREKFVHQSSKSGSGSWMKQTRIAERSVIEDEDTAEVCAKFTRHLDKFTNKLDSVIKGFREKEKYSQKKTVAIQTESLEPKPLMMANMNVQNLLKEFSKAFMLSKPTVNPTNQTASQFFKKLYQPKLKADSQQKAAYREIFAMTQEHVLVEETLRMIQDKGYDLEALFMAAYHKLGVKGADPQQSAKKEDEEPPLAECSAVDFDSVSEEASPPKASYKCNIYDLDFDSLNKSSSEDQ